MNPKLLKIGDKIIASTASGEVVGVYTGRFVRRLISEPARIFYCFSVITAAHDNFALGVLEADDAQVRLKVRRAR